MKTKKMLMTVAATTALVAVPAFPAAAKKGGETKLKSQGKSLKSKKCQKPTKVGFTAEGTLAGLATDSVTLTVTKANKHARGWIAANGSDFSLAGAKLGFEGITDDNGTGLGLDDVVATDRVHVIGKLAQPKRGCDADAALVVTKIKATREAVEPEVEDPAAA